MRQCLALITAEKEKGSGYRQFPVQRVQAFQVDSSMDQDSDSFSVDLGDPDHELNFLLRRDTEIRVNVVTFDTRVTNKQLTQLHTGFADSVSFDAADGVMSIVGRDASAAAVDSQHEPGYLQSVKPHIYIADRFTSLGITSHKLQPVKEFAKLYTDGSETEWEFAYRMYRKRGMWIWTEPDGTVYADKLNSTEGVKYWFGRPEGNEQASKYMPVQSLTITHDNRGRVGECWVFGATPGGKAFRAVATDNAMRTWVKRPLKVMTTLESDNVADALDEAKLEITDGQVGAIEITVEVPDPGYLIRQNNLAKVNLPAVEFTGEFFVVGVEYTGNAEGGFTQTVRLREKEFALSKRVPRDPELPDPKDDPSRNVPPSSVSPLLPRDIKWKNSFASAAQEFKDGWPLGLFLSVLLAICDHESSFQNVRTRALGGANGGQWYPMPTAARQGEDLQATQLSWKRAFANERDNVLNPGYEKRTNAAVGPMQLVTDDYRTWADEYGGKGHGGSSGEYDGGRWMPPANIRAGARAFAAKLAASGADPKQANQIWLGVELYYGSTDQSANIAYRNAVQKIWREKYKDVGEGIDTADAADSIPPGDKDLTYNVRDAYGKSINVRIPGIAPTQVKDAIRFCLRQLGEPYRWAGVGPNEWDCSGLVAVAYREAGVNSLYDNAQRPNTYTLWANRYGKKVTKDQLLPGDLIYFSHGGDIHHVGMYLGESRMIHAPHTGDVVKISYISEQYYRDEWHGANRFVTWPTDGGHGGV